MSFNTYSFKAFQWGGVVLALTVLGCGPPKPEIAVPTELKGKIDVRSTRSSQPPNESGKAVLDELGVSDLKSTRKSSDNDTSAKNGEANNGKESKSGETAATDISAEKPDAKAETAYRRPSRWIETDKLPYEFWEVQYLGNRPVGYLYQRVGTSATGSVGIYRIDAESFVRISREKQLLDQRLKVTTFEEVDGRLKAIEATLTQGDKQTKIEGSVILGSLRLRIQRNDSTTGVDIPWPNDFGGPFSVAQSLLGRHMKSGETRTLSMLDPILGQVVKIKLQAKDHLKTPLMDGLQHNLLEIQSEVKLGDKGLASTLWVNKDGETQKTYTSDLDIRSFRVERSFAESIRDAANCESMTRTEFELAEPIADYASAKSLTFRIRHQTNDPMRMFVSRTNQSLKAVNAFTVDATVYAMHEKSTMPDGISPELVDDPLCSQPSPVIQSNDKAVKKLAAQFFEDKSLGSSVLERLRRGVYHWIENKTPYSPVISSAAEVARNRTGDSSEHAMLLAALVRASKVPSRVAIGLKYNGSKDAPALVLHMWTEVYLVDHWISIDASQEEANTNATYLKFVDTPMANQNPYGDLLTVLRLIDECEVAISE
ncbi:MAG: transglutaminase-like domain-containing protein [Pirellulaceae bacterium]|nr:transglutaminase-like domain-containing protein [Pirellulaceae bacterium]